MESSTKINKKNNSISSFLLQKQMKLPLKDLSEIKKISPLMGGGIKIKPKDKKLKWKEPNFVEIVEIPSIKRYIYNDYLSKKYNCCICNIF